MWGNQGVRSLNDFLGTGNETGRSPCRGNQSWHTGIAVKIKQSEKPSKKKRRVSGFDGPLPISLLSH